MSKTYEEEQAAQQRYFDEQDRFDPIQHELDMEAAKITGVQIEIKYKLPPQKKHRPAHNTPLPEKTRAYNLAMWVLRKNVKK